jgi:hypothetical protein
VHELQRGADGQIKHDAALLQESTELAKIMAKAFRTAKGNDEGTIT